MMGSLRLHMIPPLTRPCRGKPNTSCLRVFRFGFRVRAFSFSHHQITGEQERALLAKRGGVDLTQYPPEKIRNFSIIAHIDHGKSTLADRLLELTGTIQQGLNRPQYLDKLQVERERGITVKAQTASMLHRDSFQGNKENDERGASSFLLNLIDTPGHVDFSYEVSRSLAACQGVLLVVDAVKGIQAQTIANFYLASKSNLTIIPVINKIDLPAADPDNVKHQLATTFGLDPNDALLTSAKTGQGLDQVLHAIMERIPSPQGESNSPLRLLLFDSYYDEYRKVICHVAVIDGVLRKGEKIMSAASGKAYRVSDVGIMHPELKPTATLLTGQVGYVVCGMQSTNEARVGDTLYHVRSTIEPLPGFKPVKHMVFSGLYPCGGTNVETLKHAVEKLACNDSSVSVTKENSPGLGQGFRCGFLGLLHRDVFHQRLEQEYGVQAYSTIPTVPYMFEYSDGSKVEIQNPAPELNEKKRVIATWEPTVLAKIIIPSEYLGPVITLCSGRRGEQMEHSFLGSHQAFLKYRLPLREIVVDFYDLLKTITSGYALFDYEDAEYQICDLAKIDVFLNGKRVDAMATIVLRSQAQEVSSDMLEMLKKFLDRSKDNDIRIIDVIKSEAIAFERVPKCKQKEVKRQIKCESPVYIPPEAFADKLKFFTSGKAAPNCRTE